MTIGQSLLAEIKQESAATRALLALVPYDNPTWKPHEKSMELNRLAAHVAEIGEWVEGTITMDELDMSKGDYKPTIPENTEALLNFFDACQEKADKALSTVSDEDIKKPWTMRNGEQIYLSLPKDVVLRTWCMNHLIHHRAQLGVYLRLLNIPLPGTYGPSADMM